MTGISQDLSSGVEYGVYITVINPNFSGITGTFELETGRNNTFTVIDRQTNIQGVYISAGIISDISLLAYDTN